MAEPTHKRTTVYFEPSLHRALRLKAAEVDSSVSELVNEAVREALAEDARILPRLKLAKKSPS